MIWLWILGGIAVLIAGICLLRLRVQMEFGDAVSADLYIGFFHTRLFPAAGEKKEKEPAPEKTQKSALQEKLKTIPKPSADDIKDAYRTLKPVFLRTLHRTRRGIRIHPLEISLILGGREDPAQAAEYYGYANAAVWTVMPALESLLVIPEPHIHIGMDFDAAKTKLRGTIGAGMRVGTLLVLALGIAIPVIRWFTKYRKRKQTENKTEKQPLEASAA